jgi:hypothetical protein
MNNTETTNQEIDLIYLFKKAKEFIFYCGLQLYRLIVFIKKNILILLGLLVIGILIGFLIEKFIPTKENSELMVVPNFSSTEYLYKEIELLNNAKSTYKELDGLSNLAVQPIYNVEDLVDIKTNIDQEQSFLSKYLENGNIKKEMSDKNLKSLYKYHLITFETDKGKNSKQIGDNILKIINANTYFNEKRVLEQKNLVDQKTQLNKSIDQINDILSNINNSATIKDEKGVNINTYNELSKLVDVKNDYVNQISKIDTKIIQSKSTVYLIKESLNVHKISKFTSNLKFIVPAVLIVFFLLFKIYQSLKSKYQSFI